jgi:endoglucanase
MTIPSNPVRCLRRLVGVLVCLQSALLFASSPPDNPPDMWGVNLSAAGFGSTYPGTHGVNYIYPDPTYLDYYKARGIELIRFPIRWERIQHSLFGPLDATELARLDAVVDAIEARGMRIIIDVHNYARYNLGGTSYLIGTPEVPRSAYQDLWEKLAAHFEHRDCLWAYGIMNEPYGVGAYTWKDTAQYAVDGIRLHDTRHAILIPGDVYSSARLWTTYSANLIDIVDPAGNLIFEAHSYFDNDSSGTYDASYDVEGATPTTGVTRLSNFVNWCNANGVRGFVGEYGVPDNDSRWNTLLDNALDYMRNNNVSGTYWAGGPWWGDYALSTEPRRSHDEAPQMSVLINYGDGPGTRHWPSFTWYKDSVASGTQGSSTYTYKSETASLTVDFADPDSAIGNYSTKKGITLSYTIPSGGWAGAGMQINGGANLVPNFARDHILSFYLRGTAGSSVRVILRDTDGAVSAPVDTAAYVTSNDTWQQVRIPLAQFIGGGFTGAQRIDRVAVQGLPANNTAHLVRLDTFVIEKPDTTPPTATVASPGGTTFNVNAPFTATATASDSGGAIDFVEFLINGERQAIDETAPYAATLSLPAAGDHRLTAIAYDLHGNPGRSVPVALTAVVPPPRTLIASDTWDQTSFTSGARWSDGQPPQAGFDYIVDGLDLRSPGNSSSHTFQGNSLLLQNGGRLVLRTTSPGAVTIGDMYANDGYISLALNSAFTLAGNLTLQSGGLAIGSTTANRTLTIASRITGSGGLTIGMANATDSTTLTNPANAYAGGTSIMTGQLRAHADHALGRGDITVANGASLRLAQGAQHRYIADTAALVIGSAATVELAFEGIDAVGALSLDGGATFVAAGVWGAVGSGATNTPARLTGTGRLQVGEAGYVQLTASDTWDQTSFTSGARWSDGQVPHAGATYVVDGLDLRTPGNTSSHTFPGDALLLLDGGRLVMRTTGPGVVTAGDLYSNNGHISLALNGAFTLAGGITLQSGGLKVVSTTSGRTLTLASQIVGSGGLTISMANATDHTTLTHGANTYSGGTTVTSGVLRVQAAGALGAGNVKVASGSTLDLDYAGTDTVNALSLDGGATYLATGTWGAPGSGAANTSAQITGAGLILVTSATP